jgi:predicted transposase/invertase (TIGR01784 family)
VSIVICGGVLLDEEPEYYNTYSIRNARSGREFTDVLELNILEPAKLPVEPDGEKLFNWGQFFRAETPEELAMIGEMDPAIKEAAALVMELNEDDRERLLAFDRWKWQMDQAGLKREGYREGREAGLKDGKKEGRQEGRKERAIEIARTLKVLGDPVEKIARATGLSAEAIAAL